MSLPLPVEKMNVAERLQAMELLWDSLRHEEGVVDSPAWHGEVLSKRLQKVEQGKARFLSLQELKRKLRK